jgi:bifunctional non-homologous end joining protein LigD
MAKKSIHVEVGRRTIELSNLEKVLYHDLSIVKAEVIQYYHQIAPVMLKHIKNRPLSLVRFPDGIGGEFFFQKNKPKWAPEWIESTFLGSKEQKKEYILATEEASIVWLSNLACLEVHQMQTRKSEFATPDYIVFDLDPPEGYDFTEVVDIAMNLREDLEGFGYNVFVKTTGGKGVHILCPVEAKYSYDQCFEALKDIVSKYIQKDARTTLHIKKESRKGRVLIDIYRNRNSQTIISPYSMRGREEATVSMPLSWDELEQLKSPDIFTVKNVADQVITNGDAWEGIRSYSTALHTDKEAKVIKTKKLPINSKHKSEEQLKEYEEKRDFSKTPEPKPFVPPGEGNGFVIHRHHASHLHYDLRLEEDGVLKSWALPKGLPDKPGVKRLAVQTEDHPMKYLNFEGTIPKKEYGGGEMWVYALGRYEITKEKKNGFYFQLNSKDLTGEYRMHLMKGKEWLIEKVDHPVVDFLGKFQPPMLADLGLKVPPKKDYVYEVKWDGIRAMIQIEDERLTIYSRNGNNITNQFPELQSRKDSFRITNGLFDGEIVSLDPVGRPKFKTVIKRLMLKNESEIKRQSVKNPVYCYLFDAVYIDGRSLLRETFQRRRIWLDDSLRKGTNYRISEIIEDGEALFEAAKAHDLEGIVAKEKDGKYYLGKRNSVWQKVKVRRSADCKIIGYTIGKGEREQVFGALHLVEEIDSELVYRGKVGTGFNFKQMKELTETMKTFGTGKKPIKQKVEEERDSVWLENFIPCEINFASITDNQTFREPVFSKLRLDLV